ncbi:3-deoxy-D-manno-octulosonic-acid transferase [Halobacteroides halobius DSM 5150]|uniref:3-deoxy-D-manno-octulosonic-acid transferase n=1 Tax=Halobacteroides halobius (strain ATCC 35273 / DSM 5150 / MD-1) TaxID=748449 RepID=L0KCL0_HALHC|nr:glycosyltransferase N-terminal domain-containing protein [Halobacteroides halobius]AGB42275.1 3-deoxy-D-manno-octulosonic-acid transferase [Halobacteroides halobius DSM 5150]
MRVAYWLYDLLLLVVFIFYLPVMLYKIIFKGEPKEQFKQRLGFLSARIKYNLSGKQVIWVHAASVGETGAAEPLVTKLRDKFPKYKILFSTMTTTGQEMAHKLIDEADEIIYFPFDLPWIIKRVLQTVNPELIVLMETELWPNLISQASKKGSQIMVASGRISDQSIDRYQKLGPFVEDVLAKIDSFSMQSQLDKERIITLGANEDIVYNNGNTKFDQEYGSTSPEAKEKIYQEFKLDPKEPIIVAGSTHEDEEEQLLSCYQKLKEKFPDLVLLLAPRYVVRKEEIEAIYHRAGIKTVRRSRIKTRDPQQESVIIVDTIGELASLYGIADLVFVGGSLIDRGGHNILEPAAQGKLVFFGPAMYNFKDSTELLLEHGVGIQVQDADQLAVKMACYLKDRARLKAKNRQALDLIKQNQGAARANAKLAQQLIATRKILLVRLSAIGDVIHALPVARAVRETYPQAQLTWIVEEKAKDLVIDNPNLDRVIVLPKEQWKADFKANKRATLKEAKEFFAKIRKEYDFDLALDLHGLFKSGLTAYLSGAKRRIGSQAGQEGSPLFYNQQLELPTTQMHQIDKHLYLAKKGLGATSQEVGFDIVISKEEKIKVDQLLTELKITETDKLVAINPLTSWESKNWLPSRYAQLADRLIKELDVTVIFTGGPSDQEQIEAIQDQMDTLAYNLAGQTNLKETAELYRRALIFVGGDTGPLHLAVAMGLPAVALFGPTTPVTHGPYGKEHIVIQPDIECKKCWKRECPKETHRCMEEITVDQVFSVINQKIGV